MARSAIYTLVRPISESRTGWLALDKPALELLDWSYWPRSAFAGTHIQTGEEVGIKLVSELIFARLSEVLSAVLRKNLLQDAPLTGTTPLPQESVRTKHPQLLYESKLYKILQGGSKCSALVSLLSAVAAFSTARTALSARGQQLDLQPESDLRKHQQKLTRAFALQPGSQASGGLV